MKTLDGLKVNLQSGGEGPVVLALHGWGGSIQSVAPVQTRLTPLGYRVIALDLPGFGQTSLPPAAWGVSDYARFIVHLLDDAGIERVHLIGHSFGGRISIVLGADYPNRVNKIVLTDSAGIVTPPSGQQQAIRTVKNLFNLPGLNALQPTVQKWVRGRYGSDDLKNAGPLEPTFLKVVAEDLAPRAAKIKAPTLLIWGDQDQDTPLWQGQLLEKTIPDAGLVVFKGAGHFAFQERIGDFIRIVDTFFKGKG